MDDRLKKFIAVVEHGGFNKAAQATHISQPALSMAIKQLEQELEVTLFSRSGRSSELTEAGQTVYQTAVTLRVHTDQLRQQLTIHKNSKPLIQIGMIDSLAELLFVQHNILEKLSRQAHISLIVDGSQRLTDAVTKGTLDSAYIVMPQSPLPSTVNVQSLGKEKLVAVSVPSFDVRLKQNSLPFIAYNEHASSQSIIDAALKSRHIDTHTVMRSTSPEIMLKLCLLGAGFTVLPEYSVRQYLNSGELIQLSAPREITIERPLLAITHKATTPHPAIEAMFELTTHLLIKR